MTNPLQSEVITLKWKGDQKFLIFALNPLFLTLGLPVTLRAGLPCRARRTRAFLTSIQARRGQHRNQRTQMPLYLNFQITTTTKLIPPTLLLSTPSSQASRPTMSKRLNSSLKRTRLLTRMRVTSVTTTQFGNSSYQLWLNGSTWSRMRIRR